MNTALKNQVLKYATEDVVASESNDLMISDTKLGLITIVCVGTVYAAYDKSNNMLTKAISKTEMIEWVSNQYIIEA